MGNTLRTTDKKGETAIVNITEQSLVNDFSYADGKSVRIVVMSDTHTSVRTKEDAALVPAGDIFIHCGDFTVDGTVQEVVDFNRWLGYLPHPHRIVIAGNHDLCCHPESYRTNVEMCSARRKAVHGQQMATIALITEGEDSGTNTQTNMSSEEVLFKVCNTLCNSNASPTDKAEACTNWRKHLREVLLSNATLYLEGELSTIVVNPNDNSAVIQQFAAAMKSTSATIRNRPSPVPVRIGGAPYTNIIAISAARAFSFSEEEQRKVFDSVLGSSSPRLDVLVTHGPPQGVLDTFLMQSTGSLPLAEKLSSLALRNASPTFHVFGHVHKQRGLMLGSKFLSQKQWVPTTFINASSVVGLHHHLRRETPAVVFDLAIDQLTAFNGS